MLLGPSFARECRICIAVSGQSSAEVEAEMTIAATSFHQLFVLRTAEPVEKVDRGRDDWQRPRDGRQPFVAVMDQRVEAGSAMSVVTFNSERRFETVMKIWSMSMPKKGGHRGLVRYFVPAGWR